MSPDAQHRINGLGASRQYEHINDHASQFLAYLKSLSPREALVKGGAYPKEA